MTGKGYHGETSSDHFTDSASTLPHGDLCSAAQLHHYTQLMNSEQIYLGFFLQGALRGHIAGTGIHKSAKVQEHSPS